MNPQEVFAKRLKELREENNLTQEQLADKISTNKQVLSRYEKNQREPGINIVTKMVVRILLCKPHIQLIQIS